MKFVLAILAASLAVLGIARAREPYRLPDNYRDWLEWTPPQDRRPFLARLFSKPSLWAEVGAEKARMKVDGKGVDIAGSIRDGQQITIKDAFPTGVGVGIKFGTDL